MSKKKKKKDDLGEPSSPAWMTTYGDMMTLLLCFFVLLISFSNIDKVKFSLSMRALQGALGVMPRMSKVAQTNRPRVSDSDIIARMQLNEKINELRELAKALGYQDDITVKFTEGGMLIRMGSRVLFDLGKATLRQSAFPILKLVGETIEDHETEDVIVGGHTDNLPINTPKYPSNWELSVSRALTVVKFLMDSAGVSPDKLIAAGYSQYHPMVPNDSPHNRQKNRRVEFLFNW